jgi:hypothetical protein
VLIEPFEDVQKVPGLRLNTTRPQAGTPVHIGVAGGERVGVSSGHILNAREQKTKVAPAGRVSHPIAVGLPRGPGFIQCAGRRRYETPLDPSRFRAPNP